MAYLDMSDAFDPAFLEEFVVHRRKEMVVDGRTKMEVQVHPSYGTICAATPNQLNNLPDGRSAERGISVVTQDHLKCAEAGYQPDLVVWRGSQYQVASIDNYPHLGVGFFQVVAISTTSREGAL
jgi:hypothetical protein